MNFKALCEELRLDLELEQVDAQKLQALQEWCYEKISSDIHFDDTQTISKRYQQYIVLAKTYLDDFLPNIPEQVTEAVPLFKNMSALELAAFRGFDRFISSIKTKSPALSEPNAAGMTAAHLAATQGHVNTTAVLVSLGADITKVNHSGQLPIHSALFLPVDHDDALKEKKVKIFRLLKEKAPDSVMQADKSGDTVLHQMAANGFALLIKETLATHPKVGSIKNKAGHFPVHTAILNNQIECVRTLLGYEGGSAHADHEERDALHYAAMHGNKRVVKLCVNATKEIDPRDTEDKTPLMLAALMGNLPVVKILIGKSADIHLTDDGGNSVLHLAVQGGSVDTVRWLLDNTDVEINRPNRYNQTPLSFCDEGEPKDDIKSLLIEHGATSNNHYSQS